MASRSRPDPGTCSDSRSSGSEEAGLGDRRPQLSIGGAAPYGRLLPVLAPATTCSRHLGRGRWFRRTCATTLGFDRLPPAYGGRGLRGRPRSGRWVNDKPRGSPRRTAAPNDFGEGHIDAARWKLTVGRATIPASTVARNTWRKRSTHRWSHRGFGASFKRGRFGRHADGDHLGPAHLQPRRRDGRRRRGVHGDAADLGHAGRGVQPAERLRDDRHSGPGGERRRRSRSATRTRSRASCRRSIRT